MTTQQITPSGDTTQKNESRFQLTSKHISLVLVVIGIFISAYLSYSHLIDEPVVCMENQYFDCGAVQNSIYSEFMGIPVAYIGLAAYLVLGALLILENQITFLSENGKIIIFALTLFSFMFSMWLVYIQAIIIEAFCTWCLSHELIITLLFIVSGRRLWRSLQIDQ